MILASVLAVVFGLLVAVVVARLLYRYSFKKGMLNSRKDYVINGVIVGFVFFCVSSFIYLVVLNTIA